jgi:8-oxo-dGTP pyrophosphatase MutT (NUDIX family)
MLDMLRKKLYRLDDNISLTEQVKINAKDNNRIPSAVLIVIHFTYNEPRIILCKRSSKLSKHANQISFPGGVYKDEDKDILVTALRECMEEIGLEVKKEHVIGYMDTFNTFSSNFVILPFVAFLDLISMLKPNPREVDEIIDAPLHELLKCMYKDEEHAYYYYTDAYKFVYKGYVIWGATARILKALRDMIYYTY